MLLTAVLAAIFSALSAAPPHIERGRDAEYGSYPWLLRLYTLRNETTADTLCGANLIRIGNDDWSDIAITAAHCIDRNGTCYDHHKKFLNKVVFYDNHPANEAEIRADKMVKIIDGICHQDWNPSRDFLYDIAVLKLETPLKFNDMIDGIDLPEIGDIVKPGTTCKVAGWGYTKEEITEDGSKASLPTKLQELEVEIASDEACAEENRGYSKYKSESRMCEIIRADDGNTLSGDSGSGLVCKSDSNHQVLHGILSGGLMTYKQVGHQTFVGSAVDTYEEISYHIKWIRECIDDLSES